MQDNVDPWNNIRATSGQTVQELFQVRCGAKRYESLKLQVFQYLSSRVSLYFFPDSEMSLEVTTIH
jgi:hypothetical protein